MRSNFLCLKIEPSEIKQTRSKYYNFNKMFTKIFLKEFTFQIMLGRLLIVMFSPKHGSFIKKSFLSYLIIFIQKIAVRPEIHLFSRI